MSETAETSVVENPTEVVVEPEIEIVDESFEPEQEAKEIEQASSKPVADEDEERQKKHISLKAQFNKVQRDKYRAEHEAQLLRAELEKYRMIAERNSEAAMGHYDKTIEMQIQQAKEQKKAAKENGDYDAELAADEKLAMAIAQKAQNDAYKAQQQYLRAQQTEDAQQQQQYQQEQQYQQPEISEDAKEWLQRNPWFISNNEQDQILAQEVQSFSEVLERKYRRQGMEDRLFSKDYFDEIDSYIKEQIYEEPAEPRAPANQSRGNINMKPVRQAAPVGRTPKGPDAPARRTVSLSPSEKEMAKIMNLSEQDYAKWKIKDQEKQAQRGRPY